jgi:hypothetical protein
VVRVSFAVDSDGGALIDQCYVGFSFGGTDCDGQRHSLDLTRATGFGQSDPDWGPYLEYNGVECREPNLAAVRLSRSLLSLDLSRPFAGQMSGPVGFDLALTALSDLRFGELAAWLPIALRAR